jgi:hypothetical protein
MTGKAKKPPSKAIQRWDTEGGASQNGPQQEPRRKRPKAAKKGEKPFSGDFLENPGSAGEMHFSYESREKRPRVQQLSRDGGVGSKAQGGEASAVQTCPDL